MRTRSSGKSRRVKARRCGEVVTCRRSEGRLIVADRTAPPKQRHTAARVYRRLRDESGYRGGYAQVQRDLRKHRRRHEETIIPLGHLPGRRLEADFGHIHADFPDGRRPVPFLVATWAYSNAPFVLALPFERTEATQTPEGRRQTRSARRCRRTDARMGATVALVRSCPTSGSPLTPSTS
jgi:transposase